mmetsp:Transcript_4254/g.27155  ORF Transcript_4254/g.27155 Transcript_4254/m.27155 type:complete len:346 (+) Transcript_4254:37-1074(+)
MATMAAMDGSETPLGTHVRGLEGCMGVSEVRVAGGRVAASLWDGGLAVCDARCLAKRVAKHETPRLGCCYVNGGAEEVASVCADGTVWCHDVICADGRLLGVHDAGARCVRFVEERNLLLTGGWDKNVLLWDLRETKHKEPVARVQLANKVYAMDTKENVLVVGCAGREVSLFDLRKSNEPWQRRESSLRAQTRAISVSQDAKSFVMAAMDGRVAVEFADPDEGIQAKKYAFKCHRENKGGEVVVHPVQAVAHHPRYHHTFVTGGGDGCFSIWEGQQRKKLLQSERHPVALSSICFNEHGTIMAVGTSRTGAFNQDDGVGESIFIRQIDEAHVRPRTREHPRGVA